MKKLSMLLLSSVFLSSVLLSENVNAAPSTKGRIGLGGETILSLATQQNTNANNLLNPSLISLRYGFSDSMNFDFLGNIALVGDQFVLGLGGQVQFKTASKKDVQPYYGAGLLINGVGQPTSYISLLPTFGVEYFITNDLTLDASIGLPISLVSVKDAGMKFAGITTTVRPVLGFHYYF